MKAILFTRCGCQRTMPVTYPPPPAIHIPLDPGRRDYSDLHKQFSNPEPAPAIMSRRFVLDSLPWGDDKTGEAYYVEEAPR